MGPNDPQLPLHPKISVAVGLKKKTLKSLDMEKTVYFLAKISIVLSSERTPLTGNLTNVPQLFGVNGR